MHFALKKEYHHSIYFFLLGGLAVSIPLSNFFMSFSQLALCLNWLWEGDFKRKFANKKNNIFLGSFLLLFFTHIFWLANTQDFAFAFDDLRRKLPLLAIPILVFTSRPLSRKQCMAILIVYCLAVFGGSVVGTVRSFHLDDNNYRSIIPFISHIRFSLNVCLVIFILLVFIFLSKTKNLWLKGIAILLAGYFFYFLFLLQSYTGICISLATGFIFVIRMLFIPKVSIVKKSITTVIALLSFTAFLGLVIHYVEDYYTLKTLSTENKVYTANGNLYSVENDFFIENGNYIYKNICKKELSEAWALRSHIGIEEEDKAGNMLYYTLIRYLNSKNLPKDAQGVKALTGKDVKNVEMGIANYYYVNGNLIRKLTYKILFQIDTYKAYGQTKGHSLLQRIELWKTACSIIKTNPIFGVGTGDVPQIIKMQLAENDSDLKGMNIRIHNQYLTFLVAFGIVGFLLIMFALFYGVFKEKIIFRDTLFIAFFVIALLSMISEDTLETEAGVTFFSFFYAFLFTTSKQRTDLVKNEK